MQYDLIKTKMREEGRDFLNI